MEKYDYCFGDSQEQTYPLAGGYCSHTAILWEEEKVVVDIEAAGSLTFTDKEGNVLTSLTLPAQTGGREVYQSVICKREANQLILMFPVVAWIDNYPHCDGEYDRWDAKTIGYHTVSFDPVQKKAALHSF